MNNEGHKREEVPIMEPMIDNYWTFGHVWNKSLEEREEREMVPRSRLWASELGKSPVDIFLKLKGEKLTNPPNARSMRKFEAGNVWEWIVGLVLLRAGILQSQQDWVMFQYPDQMLPVSGKIDFLAGGKPDFAKARKAVDEFSLPDVFNRAFKNIIAHFEKNYKNGLVTKVLEIKSLGSFMYDSLERTGKASKIHRLQCFHYLKCTGIKRGDVVYICRDDCRMMEIPVYLEDKAQEKEYYDEIKKISEYFYRDEMPPLESPIVWDDDLQKFAKNFNVAYSGYLTKLYGFKDQAEFDDIYQPTTERWNRVLGRVKRGDKMTAKNLEVLEEIRKAGYDTDNLVKKLVPDPDEEVALTN